MCIPIVIITRNGSDDWNAVLCKYNRDKFISANPITMNIILFIFLMI